MLKNFVGSVKLLEKIFLSLTYMKILYKPHTVYLNIGKQTPYTKNLVHFNKINDKVLTIP